MGLTASSQCGEASSLAFPTSEMPFPTCQNKRKKKRISNGEPFITKQYYYYYFIFLIQDKILLLYNLYVYVYEALSWRLELQPLIFILYKHLYL